MDYFHNKLGFIFVDDVVIGDDDVIIFCYILITTINNIRDLWT